MQLQQQQPAGKLENQQQRRLAHCHCCATVLGSCCSVFYTLSVSAGEETGEQVSKLEVNPLHKMDVLH